MLLLLACGESTFDIFCVLSLRKASCHVWTLLYRWPPAFSCIIYRELGLKLLIMALIKSIFSLLFPRPGNGLRSESISSWLGCESNLWSSMVMVEARPFNPALC